jgi:hypothetical protein
VPSAQAKAVETLRADREGSWGPTGTVQREFGKSRLGFCREALETGLGLKRDFGVGGKVAVKRRIAAALCL